MSVAGPYETVVNLEDASSATAGSPPSKKARIETHQLNAGIARLRIVEYKNQKKKKLQSGTTLWWQEENLLSENHKKFVSEKSVLKGKILCRCLSNSSTG